MPHTGEELGVDAAELYNAGRFKVSALADEFDAAGTKLFGAGAAAGLFARDPRLGGSLGPVKAVWDVLRDDIVGLLKETTTNMADTGEALVMSAEEYVRTDEVARAAYIDIRKRLDAENGVVS